jgi:phosphinothricin acetyltransferase
VEIRDAADADLPGLLLIYNDVIATSTAVFSTDPVTLEERRQWWRARVTLGYPVLVARDESGVVGFATFGDFRAWPGYRHTVEHSVHVRADRRGQGIGSRLIEALLPIAAACGKHVMIAGVDAANTGSIRLHERLGFERVGYLHQVGCKFGRWLDLVFLQKLLDQASAPPR